MIFYGINPVSEALRSTWRPQRLYLQPGERNPRLAELRRTAERLGVPVEDAAHLEQRCGSPNHQGVAALLDPAPELPLTPEVLAQASRLVLFDGLNDPHNFGAALRVCEVFGFPDVIYFKGNSSGLTPAAIKVSAGAVFHLRLYHANLNRAAQWLHEAGVALIVLEAAGEATIYDVALPTRLAVVIGSEGEGVRFNLRRQADQLVRIPLAGRVNSLNVSCALSAALSEFARRLAPSAPPPPAAEVTDQ